MVRRICISSGDARLALDGLSASSVGGAERSPRSNPTSTAKTAETVMKTRAESRSRRRTVLTNSRSSSIDTCGIDGRIDFRSSSETISARRSRSSRTWSKSRLMPADLAANQDCSGGAEGLTSICPPSSTEADPKTRAPDGHACPKSIVDGLRAAWFFAPQKYKYSSSPSFIYIGTHRNRNTLRVHCIFFFNSV